VKRKIISALVYAATAFALAEFLDALYGAGPLTGHVRLVQLAIAGTILFAAACMLSLFALRVGVFCALAGGVLSWPCLVIEVPGIPWGSLLSILPDANWQDLVIAILALVVSSVYSVTQLRLLLRSRASLAGRKMGLKLAATLLYAAAIFVVTNWRGIWDWLFSLRYGS
jgi:hypothetical protein